MRLFVALDLPAPVRAALAAWADAAAPAAVRRVPAENLHMTLAFLGSRSDADGAAAAAVVRSSARTVAALQTAGALWLPPRRPAVLTVALHAPAALAELQSALVAGLVDAVAFEPEARPFRPHVTVGRVPRGTRIDTRSALEPPPPELSFAPAALTLYRSHTGGAGGSRYEPLERVALSG